MEYTITALNGDSVKVESENWMTAMGKALGFFDIDITSIGRLTCSPARDGSVFIEDQEGNRSWMVRQHAAEIAVRVTKRSSLEKWEVVKEVAPPTEIFDPRKRPPGISMPADSSLRAMPLAERAQAASDDIGKLSRDQACELVLARIDEYVRAEAASVAVGTLNDPALRFAAARGPRAAGVLGRQAGLGEGLVGMCFDMRGTLLVNDVAADTPNLDQLDSRLKSLAVLCVPLLDDEATAFGVIQLINPPDRPFTRAHVEVVEVFARVLAARLSDEGPAGNGGQRRSR